MLGDWQQLDVGESEPGAVSNQPFRGFAIGQKSITFLGDAGP